MKKPNKLKRLSALLLACCMLAFSIPLSVLPTGAAAAGAEVTHTVDLTEYVVFDLAASSVYINQNDYTGSYYVSTDGVWSLTAAKTKATRTGSEKFYVFQSTAVKSATISGNILTITYVNIDNNMMINNSNVTEVMNNWHAAATAAGRQSTANYITVTTCPNLYTELVIDNIWSTNQSGGSSYAASTTWGNGGLNVNVAGVDNMNVTVKLRGDNRLAHLYYYNARTADDTSLITFTDDTADNATAPEMGSLTVIGNTTLGDYAGGYCYNNSVSKNNWNSVIGGSDASDKAYNMNFTGGVIYAGAHATENCTAIGGGGNGFGEVSISGTAVVTAVAHSTGTAIGGGIAHTGDGGLADVTISGGEVYAYNFGINAHDRVSSNQYGTTDATVISAARHIPGTAIGGGSSIQKSGKQGTVTISGGKVYAESLGGSAIGGGNTIVGTGGPATVNITGGEIEAISSAATVTFKDGTTVEVPAGTAIGGGSSKLSNGGKATVTIRGGNTLATGIGGGGSMYKAGGDSDVKMYDGTVVSTGMGGGFSEALGFAQGKVTVSGGSLNSAMSAIPKDVNGNTLYLTRVSYFYNANTVANTHVSNLLFRDASTVYAHEHIYTDSVGMIYLWLPEGAALLSGKLDNDASATYTPNNEADADIDANAVGALLYETNQPRYVVNIAGSGYYSLYFDEAMTSNFSGAVIWPQGEFSYYIQVNSGVTLTPYVSASDADGNPILTPGRALEHIGGNLYKSTIRVDSDTKVWYLISEGTTTYFALDLNNGNVTVTEKDGALTIDQGGYKMSGFQGEIYLTSSGFPTDNHLTVKSESTGAAPPIHITVGDLNINVSDTAILVESGTVNLLFDEHDNAINSSNASPITLGSENASLHIDSKNIESLRITSAGNNPVIKGPGSLSLDNQGGFLYLIPQEGTAQICVGTYEFSGNNKDLDTELYKSEGYSYELIGFLSGGNLYPSNVDPDDISSGGTSTSFAARGIRATYRGIIPGTFTVADNIFTLPLSVAEGYASIGTLQVINAAGVDVTSQVQIVATAALDGATSASLMIPSELFADGHLTIFAAANNLIPYEIISYSGSYDGAPHSISVQVSADFSVTYTYTLSGTTYTTATNPTFTNVGTYTVYVTIEEILEAGEEATYETVSGLSGTVSITKAQNKLKQDMVCPNLILGSGAPSPSAEAAFGTPTFHYYSDAEGQHPINDVSSLPAGIYYVQGVVADTPNYEGYTFDIIRFEVIKTEKYAIMGRHLGQVQDLSGATTSKLMLPSKASFTVYFETVSTGNDALTFTSPLPTGVKITLVSFDGAGNATYYYYVTTASTSTVQLSAFKGMGATNAFVCVAGTTAHYQFCFESDDLNSVFDIKLNNDNNLSLSFEAGLPYSAGFSSTTPTFEDKDGTWRITVHPQAQAADIKFLAFTVTPSTGGALTGIRSELYQQGVPTPLPMTYADGNLLVFRIADGATSVDGLYTLVLHNLPAGSYTVTADIRILGSNDISTAYVLGDRTSGNHLSKVTSYAATTSVPHLHAELTSGSRIMRAGDALSFKLTYTAPMSGTVDVAFLKRQADGSYLTVVTSTPIALTAGAQNTATTAAVTLPSASPPGTYRLQFSYGGVTYDYNVILTP